MDETGAKISALDELTSGASGDLLTLLDISDNDTGAGAMSADGTNKKMTLANLVSSLGALGLIIPTDGWTPFLETCTYASATTFTIAGDYTGTLRKGDKFQLTQTTPKYFFIDDVSYSAPNTTVTIVENELYTLANAAITSPYFSKVDSPQGFPDWLNTKCKVVLTADQAIGATAFTLANFNSEVYDIGSNFNTGTKQFTAPIAGYYTVSVKLAWTTVTADQYYGGALYVNGTRQNTTWSFTHSSSAIFLSGSDTHDIYLDSGDTLEFRAYSTSGSSSIDASYSELMVHLLGL